jgi:hypothetical protein
MLRPAISYNTLLVPAHLLKHSNAISNPMPNHDIEEQLCTASRVPKINVGSLRSAQKMRQASVARPWRSQHFRCSRVGRHVFASQRVVVLAEPPRRGSCDHLLVRLGHSLVQT